MLSERSVHLYRAILYKCTVDIIFSGFTHRVDDLDSLSYDIATGEIQSIVSNDVFFFNPASDQEFVNRNYTADSSSGALSTSVISAIPGLPAGGTATSSVGPSESSPTDPDPIDPDPIDPDPDEQPEPPSDEQPEPPSDEQPEPPSDEQPEPPSDEQPEPPSDEQPEPPSDEQPEPPSDEQPEPPSDEQPEPEPESEFEFEFSQDGWDSGEGDLIKGTFSGQDSNNDGVITFLPGLKEVTAFSLESTNTLPDLDFVHGIEDLQNLSYAISTNQFITLITNRGEGDPSGTFTTETYAGGAAGGVLTLRTFENGAPQPVVDAGTDTLIRVNPTDPTEPPSSDPFSEPPSSDPTDPTEPSDPSNPPPIDTSNPSEFEFTQTGWDSGTSDVVKGVFSGKDFDDNGILEFKELFSFNLEVEIT